MVRFQTISTVNDYYDQLGEGARLVNDVLSGLDTDEEKVIIRIEDVRVADAAAFTVSLQSVLGSESLDDVEYLHMFCNYPKQFKGANTIPMPCEVTIGTTISIGKMTQFTMLDFHYVGAAYNIVFGGIEVSPDHGLTDDDLIRFVLFINLKNNA